MLGRELQQILIGTAREAYGERRSRLERLGLSEFPAAEYVVEESPLFIQRRPLPNGNW